MSLPGQVGTSHGVDMPEPDKSEPDKSELNKAEPVQLAISETQLSYSKQLITHQAFTISKPVVSDVSLVECAAGQIKTSNWMTNNTTFQVLCSSGGGGGGRKI